MDKETKILLLTIAGAFGILWLFRPKKLKDTETSTSETKYTAPIVADANKKEQHENAVIAMQAMRDAINAKESKANLDELTKMITKDYNIKVAISKSTGKLKAMTMKGDIIAEEA